MELPKQDKTTKPSSRQIVNPSTRKRNHEMVGSHTNTIEQDTSKAQQQAIERNMHMVKRNRVRAAYIAPTADNDALSTQNKTNDEPTTEFNSEGEKSKGQDHTTSNSRHNNEPIEIFSIEAMFPNEVPDVMDPLLAYKAMSDPDVMYLHQAMKEKDKEEFIKAMRDEVRDQANNGNFTVIRKDKIPKDKRLLKAVWQMRRKRDIKTRAIKKYSSISSPLIKSTSTNRVRCMWTSRTSRW